MNVQAPIGIFDSGLGGLSVAREVRRSLPHETLLYVADHRFCPYGSRSEDEIRWRSLLVAEALVEAGAKLLIIACNTATAAALEALRERFHIPIIGLEPAIKPAAALSRSRKIGVLATPRTAASERLGRLIARYAVDGVEVEIVPAPGLVELVEAGATESPAAIELVGGYVGPLLEAGVDTIVLGCTHYPFLRPVIEAVTHGRIACIDSCEAIARRTAELLTLHEMGAIRGGGSLEILTTGEIGPVAEIADRLLGHPVRVRHLELAYEAFSPLNCSSACIVSSSAVA
jgi:glutamate racemase